MYHETNVIGNVGKDAEMRHTPSGQAVTSFPVAANRSYTDGQGQRIKETCWYRVTAWGKTAEICNQYVKKGMLVYVKGRLTPDKVTGGPRIWNTSDGKPAANFEMTAETVQFLSRTNHGDEQHEGAETPNDESEIPF